LLIQLVIAVILLHISALVWPSKVTLPRVWDWEKICKLAPVVFVNGVGLVFNTLCLRGVEAAFFQIARGLVLPLTIAVSSLHTHDLPSSQVLAAAAAVTVGFLLGVVPPPLPGAVAVIPESAVPSTLALIYGLLSSLFIAVHAVLIKTSLPHANNSTVELAYWSNAGAALMLAPFVFWTGESNHLLDLIRTAGGGDERWNWGVFVSGSVITGVFGFLLCVAGLLSVKVTSPVTHMFSSAARSVLQTLLGVWLFNDILTVNRAGSILTILFGTLYYTWVKSSSQKPAVPEVRENQFSRRKPRWDIEAIPEEETEDMMATIEKHLAPDSPRSESKVTQ